MFAIVSVQFHFYENVEEVYMATIWYLTGTHVVQAYIPITIIAEIKETFLIMKRVTGRVL